MQGRGGSVLFAVSGVSGCVGLCSRPSTYYGFELVLLI